MTGKKEQPWWGGDPSWRCSYEKRLFRSCDYRGVVIFYEEGENP